MALDLQATDYAKAEGSTSLASSLCLSSSNSPGFYAEFHATHFSLGGIHVNSVVKHTYDPGKVKQCLLALGLIVCTEELAKSCEPY